MTPQRLLLLLVLTGCAFAMLLLHLISEREQLATCAEIMTKDACCPRGECPSYVPAWNK
jgi:hypothetical protein